MTEIHKFINATIAATIPPNATLATPQLSAELQGFELPQNYSILINKLERLALGLDAAFSNLSLDRKEVEIAVTGGVGGGNSVSATSIGITPEEYILNAGPIASGRIPPPYVPQRVHHGSLSMSGAEVEYSRVVSDIWIGVILTLLIVSVIFFICSCFLYHKFQQWKNSYPTNANEPVEICRRYPVDFEAESLPSYTIVSGLPTYDDALEEFRKAGIILASPMPIIKLFDGGNSSESKDNIFDNDGNTGSSNNNNNGDGDNISISSTCTCGGGASINTTPPTPNNSNISVNSSNALMTQNMPTSATQVIELNPEQLAQLSQKRLSLQIAFNSPVPIRRGSRPRIDLYRQVNRNNLLRSRGYGGGTGGAPASPEIVFPPIHRSSSSLSLTSNSNERRLSQHRGSLY